MIMPTYNRAHVVGRAIQSVLAQPVAPVQIIVVDDGSTDDTATVLAGFPQVTVVRQSNQGVGAARTAGLAAANGEFIASLDSDDVWHAHFLPTMLAAMREHRCPVAISARERLKGGEMRPVRDTPLERKLLPASQSSVLLNANELRELCMASVMSTNSSVVLHRSVVEPWPANLRTIDDVGQHARIILRHSPSAVFVTTPLWEVSPGGQDKVSLVGRNDKCDLGWRVARELAAIEHESRGGLSKAERRAFARKRAEWLVGDSAFPLSMRGLLLPAFRAYFIALLIDPAPARAWDLAGGIIRCLRASGINREESALAA